jgi:hypothetical protein
VLNIASLTEATFEVAQSKESICVALTSFVDLEDMQDAITLVRNELL